MTRIKALFGAAACTWLFVSLSTAVADPWKDEPGHGKHRRAVPSDADQDLCRAGASLSGVRHRVHDWGDRHPGVEHSLPQPVWVVAAGAGLLRVGQRLSYDGLPGGLPGPPRHLLPSMCGLVVGRGLVTRELLTTRDMALPIHEPTHHE